MVNKLYGIRAREQMVLHELEEVLVTEETEED